MSEIQAYFDNKTIFITGSSGFLGKLLLEKLLRACFGLNKIYVLVREKKGVQPKERLETIFNSKAFDFIKKNRPNFTDKVSILTGDLELPNLGLSQDDVKVLQEEVEIVFHCGATVRFDESLKKVAVINIRGTKDLIKICRGSKKLESFVYVSTAFSNCHLKVIKEIIYEPYLKEDIFMKIVDLDDDTLNKITPIILKDLPNTYILSKGTTENVILDEGKGLPISILRPSVVSSSVMEPMPGWTDTFFAITGMFGAAALGVLHHVHGDPSYKVDTIPVDYVTNNLIAVAFDTHKRQSNPDEKEKLKIFNSTCGTRNPILWGDLSAKIKSCRAKYPFTRAVQYPYGGLIKSKTIYYLNVLFLHYFPALLVDFILILILKEPFMFNLSKKVIKFVNAISYFTLNEWEFDDTNNKALYENLSKKDQDLFNFDIESINWDDYADNFVKGLRIYLLNDPLETIPVARKKFIILAGIHYFILIVLFYLFVKIGFFFHFDVTTSSPPLLSFLNACAC
nr:putative fatty acyl-CoA reductase CG5065 [Onthophagus taurus]